MDSVARYCNHDVPTLIGRPEMKYLTTERFAADALNDGGRDPR